MEGEGAAPAEQEAGKTTGDRGGGHRPILAGQVGGGGLAFRQICDPPSSCGPQGATRDLAGGDRGGGCRPILGGRAGCGLAFGQICDLPVLCDLAGADRGGGRRPTLAGRVGGGGLAFGQVCDPPASCGLARAGSQEASCALAFVPVGAQHVAMGRAMRVGLVEDDPASCHGRVIPSRDRTFGPVGGHRAGRRGRRGHQSGGSVVPMVRESFEDCL